MSNQQALDYIKQAKAAGMDDMQIKQELLKAGWQQLDIDEAFKSFAGAQILSENISASKSINYVAPKKLPIFKLLFYSVLVILFVSLVGFGFWYFDKQQSWGVLTPKQIVQNQQPQNQVQENQSPAETPESENAQPEPVKTLSPKDLWLAMKVEFEQIQNYEDFIKWSDKYVSKAQIADRKNEYDNLSSSDKERFIAMVKGMSVKTADIKNIEEEIIGNSATLKLTLNDPDLRGIIKMVLEDNVWKLDLESLQTKQSNQTWEEYENHENIL